LILVSPVAVVGYSQLHQIRWIKPPTVSSLLSVERLVGDPLLFVLVLAIVACAVVVSTRSATRPRPRLDCGSRRSVRGQAAQHGAAVAALPPPPADRLGDPPRLQLPLRSASRPPPCSSGPPPQAYAPARGSVGGSAAERRATDTMSTSAPTTWSPGRSNRGTLNIGDQAGPRKATGERTLEGAYPYGLTRLRDISAGASPQQSATLGGTYASAAVIRQRLTHVTRLWVVEWTTPKPVPVLDGLGFRLIHSWDVTDLWLRLYTTRAGH
jgi:hypothetical protein